MVFAFLFEISDLWRHLAIFFNIFKIKPNVPFIGFGVKKWIILTIFSQNSSFLKWYMNWLSQFERNFWQKSQCDSAIQNNANSNMLWLNVCWFKHELIQMCYSQMWTRHFKKYAFSSTAEFAINLWRSIQKRLLAMQITKWKCVQRLLHFYDCLCPYGDFTNFITLLT